MANIFLWFVSLSFVPIASGFLSYAQVAEKGLAAWRVWEDAVAAKGGRERFAQHQKHVA